MGSALLGVEPILGTFQLGPRIVEPILSTVERLETLRFVSGQKLMLAVREGSPRFFEFVPTLTKFIACLLKLCFCP